MAAKNEKSSAKPSGAVELVQRGRLPRSRLRFAPLPHRRTRKKQLARSAQNHPARHLRRPHARRFARPLPRRRAAQVHRARRRRNHPRTRPHQARPRQAAAALEQAQETRLNGPRDKAPNRRAFRRRRSRSARTVPRSGPAETHRHRLRRGRNRRRANQPAGRLPRRRLAQARQAAGRHHPEHQRRRKIHPHGSRAVVLPRRRPGQILRHDRPEPLLPRRVQPETQDPRHRRRGGRGESQLRAQAPAIRRRTDHREHRQGPAQRPHGNPGIPRRRPGRDRASPPPDRHRRGADEPLSRSDRR